MDEIVFFQVEEAKLRIAVLYKDFYDEEMTKKKPALVSGISEMIH